jgi:hypothetical protein
MRAIVTALALLGFCSAASAETAQAKREAIAEAFETALREHVVFLNCTATDQKAHTLARQSWEDMVGLALVLMDQQEVDPAFIAQIKERGAYAKLMRLDSPLRDILALCPEGWEKPLFEFRMVLFHVRVREILIR